MTREIEIIQGEFFGELLENNWEVRVVPGFHTEYVSLGHYATREEAELVQFKDMGDYMLTAKPALTPDKGAPAFEVHCTCTTHAQGKNGAIVRTVTGEPNWKTIHGNVTLAHHPILGKAEARKGNTFPI